jgi:hypothetical protein
VDENEERGPAGDGRPRCDRTVPLWFERLNFAACRTPLPPDAMEARIARYAARAALRLPLFEGS